MIAFFLLGVAGAAGAVARYLVSTWLPTTVVTTLTVNVLGSFALGLVLAANLGDPVALALGTGFCGAFTTFSSFAVEVVNRFQAGEEGLALGYGVGMAVGAILAVLAGGWLGAILGVGA